MQESKINLHVVVGLPLNNIFPTYTSYSEETPPLGVDFALDEPALRGDTCA